ncbi:MAG: hypothetical protein ACLP50_25515 [Solirubrobacteraceae bacterium]
MSRGDLEGAANAYRAASTLGDAFAAHLLGHALDALERPTEVRSAYD